MVPRNDKIKPHDNFAALLTVIQQQYTDTTLKQWEAEDTNQAQSFVSGLDLPHERENLAVFCPHVQKNTRLETQWHLKSTARNKADKGHCGGLFCILACQVPQSKRCSSRN
eukprot:10852143-Ditylum_brightwellii.AAC.3